MKKLGIILLVIVSFIISTETVEAAGTNCSLTSGGRYKCKYIYQTNDSGFRYAISKISTNSAKTRLYLYGWGFLDNADSYNDFNNVYDMQLYYYDSSQGKYREITSSDIISTKRVANGKVDFTCTLYHKDYKYFKSNDYCYSKVKAGSTTLKNHIHSSNKKTSSSKNNVLRNVGFVTTINLTELKKFLEKKITFDCPEPGTSWCKNTCGGKKSCSYSKTFNMIFKLKMTVPKDAVKNSDKTFYRTVRIFDKVLDSDARKVLNSYPFDLNTDSFDKNLVTYVNSGMVRSTYKKTSDPNGWQISCAGYSSKKTLCLPAKGYTKSIRTFEALDMSHSYPWTLGTSNIKFYAIKVQGYPSKGKIGGSTNGCVLFPTKQNSKAVKTIGYIPNSWIVAEGDYTKLKAKFTKTCDCTVIPDVKAVIDEDDPKTKKCASNSQEIVRDYDTIKVKSTTLTNSQLFKWLINGTNPVSNVNITNLTSVRNKYKITSHSTSACPIYCLDKEVHNFMGSKDISSSLENKKIEFTFTKPYSGKIYKKCATKNNTTCLNKLNAYLNNVKPFSIEYTNGVALKQTINTAGTKTIGTKYKTGNNTIVYWTTTYKKDLSLSNVQFTKKPEKDYKVSITVNGNKFTCPYEFDFDDEVDVNDLYYRMIDLNDVFPAHRKDNYGLNWRTTVAKELIKKIEDKGEKVYNETPELTVTLNSKTIKEIKEYNKEKEKNGKGYYDNSVTCGSDGNESCFINDLIKKNIAVRGSK